MEAKVYNQKGKDAGTIALPESIFGVTWNADLVHQVVEGIRSNKRAGTADTKGRGEVAGGGKKPWKQKGTGRARHGSIRSPLWRGGGTTHGPLAEKDYSKKINKKMRAKALYTVLAEKYRKGQILFVDGLSMNAIKTKDAADVVKNLATISGFEKMNSRKKNAIRITVPAHNVEVEKSFANIPNVSMEYVQNMNALDVLSYQYLIITDPKASLDFLAKKLA